MIYKKSKNKILALLLCMIVILVVLPILLVIFHINTTIGPFIGADAVFLPFAFRNILQQNDQTLQINSNIIFNDNGKITIINLGNIRTIKYKGIFLIPMSEMMIIESDNMDVIKVDFNFKKYKVVWGHVLEACKQNKNIEIDERLLRYAKRNTEVP